MLGQMDSPYGGGRVRPPSKERADYGNTGSDPRDGDHAQTYHGLPGVDYSFLGIPRLRVTWGGCIRGPC